MSEVLKSDDEKFWEFFHLQKSIEHFQPKLHYKESSKMRLKKLKKRKMLIQKKKKNLY